MAKFVLNAQKILGALAPGDYMDPSLPNFGLRVGVRDRTWFVRVRENGRRVRVTLGPAAVPGRAPDRNATTLTLKDARKKASDLLALHDGGTVLRPRIVLEAPGLLADDLAPETMTVAQLATAFLAFHQSRWSASWFTDARWYLAELVVPAWGGDLAKDLTRRQVRALIERYAERAPVAANRLFSIIRKMFRWAVKRDYLDAAPMVMAIDRPTDENGRDRVLSPDEIRRFWIALNVEARRTARTGRARALVDLWRLRLVTAQREKALRAMQWSWVHFDDRLVEFPARATKRKKQPTPHLVPLGPLALRVLRRRRAVASPLDLYVFGTRRGTSKTTGVTRDTPLELPDFQGKDIRRTATTLMTQHGVSDFDVSRVLNHARRADEKVTGIYNRYAYLEEKQRALETLDRVVTAILHPARRRGQVVRFNRA